MDEKEIEHLIERKPRSQEPDGLSRDDPIRRKHSAGKGKSNSSPTSCLRGYRVVYCLFLVVAGLIGISIFNPQTLQSMAPLTPTWKASSGRTSPFKSTALINSTIGESPFPYLEMHGLENLDTRPKADYGKLKFKTLDGGKAWKRTVRQHDSSLFNEEHKEFMEKMEDHDLRSKEKYDPFDDLDFPRECVRPQWTFDIFQSCNLFHDLSYDRTVESQGHQAYDIKYLAHGAFRDSFQFSPSDGKTPFVVKNKRYDRSLDRRDVHKINTEANIMEHLSSSVVTSAIYGHCGSSILVEEGYEIKNDIIPYRVDAVPALYNGRISQEELDAAQEMVGDVLPMNQDILTLEKKLDIAISMAEGLAEMHGYVGGVMTNDDIALGQWLWSEDGRVILNDFNDAIFMEWKEKKGKYCKYERSFGGRFKAPEEYGGDYEHDEAVDIWPMGNILFALLTGLYPYYELDDSEEIQQRTKDGPPYIDPRYADRSYIERRMVEVMNKCHKLNASERIDIFEVVRILKETRSVHKKDGQ